MFEISPRRLLAALGLVFACSSSALAQTAQPSILPTQGLGPLTEELIQNPSLGFDVAMRDNLAITSMPDYGFQGSEEPGGRVAVWTRSSGGSWQRSGTIDALPDGGRFGETMALGSDRAFITSGSNALQVFVRDGTAWFFEQTVLAPNSGALGVRDLAFDQGWLVAYFLGDPGPSIFARRNGAWVPVQALTSGQQNDRFGWSVAIERATLVVGAPSHDQNRGAIYIFRLNSGVWLQRQRITVPNGAPGDRFGESVAIGGNGLIAVGAPGAQPLPAPTCGTSGASGAGYFYVPSGASWVIRQVLSHRFADCHIGFGNEVAINATHLAVKSQALVPDYRSKTVLYRRVSSGAFSIVGRDRSFDFSSLAMSPTTMMVGVPFDADFGGVALAYDLSIVAP